MSLALPSSLTWRDLAARTYHEVVDDDVLGLAAQLSYYFFLALFPAILFGLALASFFPLGTLTDDLSRLLGPVVHPAGLADRPEALGLQVVRADAELLELTEVVVGVERLRQGLGLLERAGAVGPGADHVEDGLLGDLHRGSFVGGCARR